MRSVSSFLQTIILKPFSSKGFCQAKLHDVYYLILSLRAAGRFTTKTNPIPLLMHFVTQPDFSSWFSDSIPFFVTITSDIEKKIEAAEMWFIRRMLRISWAEKKTNVNVLREGNVQRSLLKTIRKRQMEFLGHVCRRRGLEFLSLTGKVEGKRDRGKQRITFLDSLCNSATGGQSKGLNFLKLSDDRDVWRGMVANVCSRSGT